MKKIIIISVCILILLIILLGDQKSYFAQADNRSPISIYYNNSNLDLVWHIRKKSLQTDPNGDNMSVQNFTRYSNSNVFFLTQHYEGTTYLYRCTLKTISGNIYIDAKDFIMLPSYGHGESIEVTAYDASTNTYTLWIGTNSGGGSYWWSRDVARIKYTVDSSQPSGAYKSEEKIITGLNAVAGYPSASNYSHRTAVSVAENDNRICFCTQLTNSSGNWYYIIYSLSEINSALDASSATSVSLSSLGVTYKSMFSKSNSSLPNGSFQSIDINGVGSNNKFLFLAGGQHTDNCKIYQYSYTNGGSSSIVNEYTVYNSSAPSSNFLYNAEIEGIKIYPDSGTDYIYMMFKQYTTPTPTPAPSASNDDADGRYTDEIDEFEDEERGTTAKIYRFPVSPVSTNNDFLEEGDYD
ncbi:MAG: hypothetical protein IKW90_01580 [Lachnospiraceae bacterium]|nr:hypothetical protein [Lachnospiraceae bacterium]